MGSNQYALNEVWRLQSPVSSMAWSQSDQYRYISALFAELSYYHVPQWEIDEKRHRALLVPCEAYQKICERGIATNLLQVLRGADLQSSFVVETRHVIAT